ncbi:hypothetical protein TIFTF001_054377 [Ficus carica]|uniref:PGG domain-containing protein n=1 Tax=Ficus carica TaxID=3494 RepID=A0AA88EG88_FICCA|nr:hypothetical protein TIFTF001_054377 [Ficus carica]
MLTAARNGITEMVVAFLRKFPVAVNDLDADKKNVVLIAVETRQLKLYKKLLDYKSPIHVKDNAFRVVDIHGNGALHLAAEFGKNQEPWLIPGEALQMQWEIKWYKFVEKSMPPHFFPRYNKRGQTPKQIFTESHHKLVKDGGKWMTSTSESCSVVAALIATVAFATSTAIPGGTNDNNGKPKLENQLAFTIFGITSLVALFFSVTSLAMFLSILTSRYQEKDFETSLPRKLLIGNDDALASFIRSFCFNDQE